jgi:hypothetical protein
MRLISWMHPTMLALTQTVGAFGPAWVDMWVLAFAIYGALKLFTWCDEHGWQAPAWRSAAYLFAWPGMDARAFLWGNLAICPTTTEWLFASAKFVVGLSLLTAGTSLSTIPSWLRAWTSMVGLVFTLHFGLFHLLSCLWRTFAIDAASIMQWPIAATSVSDFWSRRWNLAFRDLTHRYVFRPLVGRVGSAAALWIGFLLSGLVHDLVVSLPGGGGYGLPTLFFLIQVAAISLERSRLGKKFGLNRGIVGWMFTLAVLLLPAPLLFHQPFLENVVLPFLDAIGSIGQGLP